MIVPACLLIFTSIGATLVSDRSPHAWEILQHLPWSVTAATRRCSKKWPPPSARDQPQGKLTFGTTLTEDGRGWQLVHLGWLGWIVHRGLVSNSFDSLGCVLVKLLALTVTGAQGQPPFLGGGQVWSRAAGAHPQPSAQPYPRNTTATGHGRSENDYDYSCSINMSRQHHWGTAPQHANRRHYLLS